MLKNIWEKYKFFLMTFLAKIQNVLKLEKEIKHKNKNATLDLCDFSVGQSGKGKQTNNFIL